MSNKFLLNMNEMVKHFLFCLFFVLSCTLQYSYRTIAARTPTMSNGLQHWGYVEVLTKVHLFWWHFMSSSRVEDPSTPWPTILWLQGGPGGSAVAVGNFLEIGPLDGYLHHRYYTWLRKADLLFVDSPAGTGFSYVEDEILLASSDAGAATELLYLLKDLTNRFEFLRKSPLYIFGESYGGKIAVVLGLEVVDAINSKELTLKLGGVVLGNGWISPEDFVFSWGPLLKDMSRLDDNGLEASKDLAQKIKHHLQNHEYKEATSTMSNLQQKIHMHSNNVDLYNLLVDRDRTMVANVDLVSLMNGHMKKELQIIPANIIWEFQSKKVHDAFSKEYMKPRIKEVDLLLAKGVSVTVYNGQLDVICSTKGAEAWVNKLRWNGLGSSFKYLNRVPLYCDDEGMITKGFRRKRDNFTFYWILMSGHNVPDDQQCIAFQMMSEITGSRDLS